MLDYAEAVTVMDWDEKYNVMFSTSVRKYEVVAKSTKELRLCGGRDVWYHCKEIRGVGKSTKKLSL